jgi:hypothetical protein
VDFEAIGREVVRLWERAQQEKHSLTQLGRDVDRLLCFGPEAERQARKLAYEFFERSG